MPEKLPYHHGGTTSALFILHEIAKHHQCSSVSADGLDDRGSIPAMSTRFLSSLPGLDGLWHPANLLFSLSKKGFTLGEEKKPDREANHIPASSAENEMKR
jgi:hypothetical protein